MNQPYSKTKLDTWKKIYSKTEIPYQSCYSHLSWGARKVNKGAILNCSALVDATWRKTKILSKDQSQGFMYTSLNESS